MDEKIRNAILKQVEAEPFAKKFGLKLIDVQEGFAEVKMALKRYSNIPNNTIAK